MNGIAVMAAKEAAVVSGFGSGLLAPSAVDGFAVGTLLSGVCLLMAIGPRRRLTPGASGAPGARSAPYPVFARRSVGDGGRYRRRQAMLGSRNARSVGG